jgi:hypothetical protein
LSYNCRVLFIFFSAHCPDIAVSALYFLVSIVLSLPFAVYNKEMLDAQNNTICGPDWPNPDIDKVATLAVVMTSYVIPLIAIIACYSRILLHLWGGGATASNRQLVGYCRKQN